MLTSDEHTVQTDRHTVSVTGKTGLIHATWTLSVDGQEVDGAKAAGDFPLRARLADGSAVQTSLHQSLIGPTEVAIHHNGEEVTRMRLRRMTWPTAGLA